MATGLVDVEVVVRDEDVVPEREVLLRVVDVVVAVVLVTLCVALVVAVEV